MPVSRSAPQRADTPFPRSARLDRPAQFKRVFATGVRSSDGFFTVLACPNDLANARLGLAISRKAAGNAVSRNRIKRLVRESFRQHRPDLPGLDLVVMAKAAAREAPAEALRASMAKNWRRVVQRCERS